MYLLFIEFVKKRMQIEREKLEKPERVLSEHLLKQVLPPARSKATGVIKAFNL